MSALAKKTAASHPKYLDMILAAVKALGDKSGSSRQAINKYIVKQYNLAENNHHNAMLKQALKRASGASGPLVHNKGKGAAGSFKIKPVSAKPDKKVAKKVPGKKKAANKSPGKKTTSAKAKAKPEKPVKPEKRVKQVQAKPTVPEKPAAGKLAKPAVAKPKVAKKSKASSPKKPKVVKAAKKSPKKPAKKAAAPKK